MDTDTGAQIELEWKVGFSTSCLHAAEAMANGQLVSEPRIAAAIGQPARELGRAIVASGLPRAAFWRHLLGLSVSIHNNRELAELALTKTIGASRAQSLASELGGLISGLESAVQCELPDLLDEVAVAARHLRQQWDRIGLALLHCVARWTDPRLIVPRAIVVVVHPALGGGGAAHLLYNSLHIEAVPADPEPTLPELARLTWLVAQLNLDLPVFSEAIRGDRLPLVGQLAMLPVVLHAVREIGSLVVDDETLEHALTVWRVLAPPECDPVDVVCRWWETYRDTRPRWDIALTALDRMLG